MKNIWFVAVALVLVSCGPTEVSTEVVGEPIISEETHGCYMTSYCMSCGIGFDGEFNCKQKLSPMCPGTQEVRVTATPVRTHYDDSTSRDWLRKTSEPLEACT